MLPDVDDRARERPTYSITELGRAVVKWCEPAEETRR
jgi:hypothetical protein